MKRLLYISLVTVVIMLTSCTNVNTIKRESQPKDTIYTAKSAMAIFDYNPTRALLIIDSAEIIGNLSHDRASFYRAKIFTTTLEGMDLDSAQKICLTLMNSSYVKDAGNEEAVLDLLVSITRRRQDFEQWLKWSMEKAEFCRRNNNEVEALRTEAEIGVILAYLGRNEEGLQKLDDVIAQLDMTRKFNEMDACIIALRRKVDVLQQSEKYGDIIPVAEKIIEKTNDYEQNQEDYHDGSFREPNPSKLHDYCEFYRVKAYAYLARAYVENDDIENSRYYLSLFENSRYGKTFDGRMMVSMTWCKLGDYDKMLAIYDEVEKYLGNDTVNETYSTILYNRAKAANARKQYSKAYDYMQRYADLSTLLSEQMRDSKTTEYAARYHAQEQQMEIERQTLRSHTQNVIIIVLFVAIMIIVFFYNHTVFQKQKLATRNAVLVRLIDEQNHLERLTETCKMLRENPDMSFTDIAKAVGIDARELQKLFREQFGMSPSEYRNLHKK